MTSRETDIASWVLGQQERLLGRVLDWAQISSHSLDRAGLRRMAEALAEALCPLGAVRNTPVPPRAWIDDRGRAVEQALGDVLSIRHVAPRERLSILLAIHYDTVYPAEGLPPQVTLVDDGRILRGPGVADAKGGIAVLVTAIEAAMRFGAGETLSWEVLLNPDEELGSPGSAGLLADAAGRHDLGLVFEPALDEAGTLAGARKGSGNFHVVVRGRAAHAGRHVADGRNAVVAAAKLASRLANPDESLPGVTINVASIHGGDALNVVPDLAVLRFNVRTETRDDDARVMARLADNVTEINACDGFSAALTGGFHCPPKPLDGPTHRLLEHVVLCGRDIGLTITARATGGVCDGNKLAAAGLPTIDTLGVRGGGIHSRDEYLVVESLAERSSLTALVLCRLADGTLEWPRRAKEPRPCS